MALRGTFKRVRICPGKGVNMPWTSLTTNGHNCNIVYFIHTCPHMSTLTHTYWHSLSHTLSHFFIQHMLFCPVTWRLVDNRDKCRQWCAGGLMDKLLLPTAGNFWETDNVLLPCEGQHHTVAIYAKCNIKIQRIANYCHRCIAL